MKTSGKIFLLFRAFSDGTPSTADYCDQSTADDLISSDVCCYAAVLRVVDGIPAAVAIKGDALNVTHDREAVEAAQEHLS